MPEGDDDYSDWFSGPSAPKTLTIPTKQKIFEASVARARRAEQYHRQNKPRPPQKPIPVLPLGKIKQRHSPARPIEIDPVKEVAGRRAEMAIMALAIFGFLRQHARNPDSIDYAHAIDPFLGDHYEKGHRVAQMITQSCEQIWDIDIVNAALFLFDLTENYFPGFQFSLWGTPSNFEATRAGVGNFGQYIFDSGERAQSVYCEVSAVCRYENIVKAPHPYDLVFAHRDEHQVVEMKDRESIDFRYPSNQIEGVVMLQFADQTGHIRAGRQREVILDKSNAGSGIPEFLPIRGSGPVRFKFTDEEIFNTLPYFERATWPKYLGFK